VFQNGLVMSSVGGGHPENHPGCRDGENKNLTYSQGFGGGLSGFISPIMKFHIGGGGRINEGRPSGRGDQLVRGKRICVPGKKWTGGK